MYLELKYKGVAKTGFWKWILFKGNACLNNTVRNKIPVKDHTMLVYFLCSFLCSQNICYLLFWFRTGQGRLFLYKIASVADVHLNCIK